MSKSYVKRIDNIQPSAICEMLELGADPSNIPFGGGYPGSTLFPTDQLQAVVCEVIQSRGGDNMKYAPLDGLPRLRKQIAALMIADRTLCQSEDVLILQGSQQGLGLATKC
ncbi:MAG: hypothetical protein P8M25_15930 [Paracoccaceae bacterium]|nr:hypothetical protein [Paracoccaceae bacterium]